jgi:hypothetical protein
MQFELLEFTRWLRNAFVIKIYQSELNTFKKLQSNRANYKQRIRAFCCHSILERVRSKRFFFMWLVSNFKSLHVKEKNCDFHTVRGALFGFRRWSYWPITFFLRFSVCVCVCDWSGEKERKNGDVASALQRWKALFSLFQSAEIIFCKGSAGDEENGELQATYAARTGRQPLAAKKPRSLLLVKGFLSLKSTMHIPTNAFPLELVKVSWIHMESIKVS